MVKDSGSKSAHGKPKPVTKSHADLSWDQAIQHVLREADEALSYDDIAKRIFEGGLRTSGGATPAATVASNLSVSLRKEDSPYLRVSRGLYTVKTEFRGKISLSDRDESLDISDAAETGALRAFGMYWRRDQIVWSGAPRLVGRQGSGASDVNFSEQIGVYLLHDRDRVVYVGRAGDTLYSRLKAHTSDRLSSRWDRFSWFGLREVNADGSLVINQVPWSPEVVIETMEALLIESLEPPLNRKRGDNFSAVEFIQVTDPQLEKAQKQALLEEIKKGMGL